MTKAAAPATRKTLDKPTDGVTPIAGNTVDLDATKPQGKKGKKSKGTKTTADTDTATVDGTASQDTTQDAPKVTKAETAAETKAATEARMTLAEALSKHARVEMREVDPAKDVLILGLDTKDGAENPLVQVHRNTKPINPAQVEAAKLYGILEPPLLLELPEYPGKLVVAAGRQRIRWARDAKLKNVKSMVYTGLNKEQAMGIMAMENALRVEDDIIDKAEEMARYVKLTKVSPEIAAPIFAVSGQYVRNNIAVAERCHERVKKAVRKGDLSFTAATKLAKLATDNGDGTFDFKPQLAKLDEALHGAEEEVAEEEAAPKKGKKKKAAKSKKRTKASKKATQDTPFPRPKLRLLKELAESNHEIGGTFQEWCEWVCGLRSAVAIKGLSPAIKAMGMEK